MRSTLLMLTLFFFSMSLGFAQSSGDLIPYRIGDKWGYATPDKKIVITPVYEKVDRFYDGVGVVYLNKQGALIDGSGGIVAPFGEQEFFSVRHGLFIRLALVRDEGKMGLVDVRNKIALPLEYDLLSSPAPGIIELYKERKYGIADLKGNIHIPPVYDAIQYVDPSFCILSKDNNQALFMLDGRQVTPFKYMVMDKPTYGLWKMRVGDLFGFIDAKGHEVIPAQYDLTYPFSEGYAVIWKGGKWGMIEIGRAHV